MVSRARHVGRSLVIAVLVVSAGCSAFPPSGGNGTPTDQRVAPGVTTEGVVNRIALGAAHNDTLRGTSYTVEYHLAVRYPNGTMYSGFDAVTRVDGTHTRVRTTVMQFSGDVKRRSYWTDGARTGQFTTYRNGTTTSATGNESDGTLNTVFARPGEKYAIFLFQNTTSRLAGNVTRNGSTLYRVIATNLTSRQLGLLPSFNPPRTENATVHALIDDRGFVHQYNTTYQTTTDRDVTVTVTSSIRFTNVSTTTVNRPEWYENSTDRTTKTE